MSSSMLDAFPELVREYEVFRMDPLIGAGYGERYDKRIATGYVSWRRGDKQAVQGGAAGHEDLGTFWERHDYETGEQIIRHNDYMEWKGKMYRLLEDADFGLEDGFSKWKIKNVPGVTDRQVTNTKVDEAVLGDYE